ncbi:hypothetical protein Tco_1055400 [Tanacetum coccineum]|uniref:Reverse transcriptase domain-containing protein n=1 Tax=Tanacetum coccineum TaxID=301880 RepID=A0ABQ5GZI2_9ASTR
MADHLRPIEELLQIPIIGIEDAIVVPVVLANEFELKIELLDFIKAWERFKDLLRKCPHHGFSPVHQIEFFYNGLSQSDQDSLNTTAVGNLMSKNTQEALTIIENKAKVQTFRNKPQVSSKGGTSTQIDAIAALTKQVEALGYHIASMQETYDPNQESTPLVLPPEAPPLSTPTPKENPQLNPHQPLIPSRFQKDKFQALENPRGRADHFIYRFDVVDSLCDKFPIENNSLSGNLTPSSDLVVVSLSPSPTPYGDSDFLLEEIDTLLSHSNLYVPSYESFCFDIDHQEENSGSMIRSISDKQKQSSQNWRDLPRDNPLVSVEVLRCHKAQDGERPQDDDLRLCLADDLKKAQDHIQRQAKEQAQD